MKNLLKIQRRIPKQARALAKYESILDACTRVLTEQGYRKTTVTELSLESDVPIATLYQYFQNKDAILVAWKAKPPIGSMICSVLRLKI